MTSVAPFTSPLCGTKRGRRSPELEYLSSPFGKRSRQFQVPGPSTSQRRGQASLQQILLRFPRMDEKVGAG
jgi:hypothetical protein